MSPATIRRSRHGSLHRLSYVALSALTLMVFSEHLFWARPGRWTRIAELLPTFVAYAVAAYVFLAIVSHYRVRSLAALILAAAVYGWFLEGVIVQTMYDDFPLNLSFTGLAWHALISVIVGWAILPDCLSRGSSRQTAGLCAAIGAGYGLWALWWWTIEPPAVAPFAFAAYSLILTLALITSYALVTRLGLRSFRPSRAEFVVLAALATGYFLGVTVPAQPRAWLVLPPLMLLSLMALERNRRCEVGPDRIQAALTRPAPCAAQLLSMLLLPLTASAIYAIASMLALRPPTGILLYVITVPLGFAFFVWALCTVLRRPRLQHPALPAPTRSSPAARQ